MFTRSGLLRHYETMVKIRQFELKAKRARKANEIPGIVHLYIGEEAIAAGVCTCPEKKDCIENTTGVMHCQGSGREGHDAELYGKATGCCGGKGGSMHMADFSVGMLGANGIVVGGFGLALGAALAARFQGTGAILVVFFRDGACNRGTFHEAANMAAVWHLPVIFVCENNGIAGSPLHDTGGLQAVHALSKRAMGYDMASY